VWAYLLPLIKNFAHWRQKVPSGSNSVGMCGKEVPVTCMVLKRACLSGVLYLPQCRDVGNIRQFQGQYITRKVINFGRCSYRMSHVNLEWRRGVKGS
jgi:hypothetical protein